VGKRWKGFEERLGVVVEGCVGGGGWWKTANVACKTRKNKR
jgi:hypothetical protein